jgi:hypothetical protein
MQIANQFHKVGLFLTHDRLVAILKQVATTPMATVKGARVSGQQGAHSARQRPFSCAREQMEVVRKQGPGIHMKRSSLSQGAETGDEVIAIRVIAKYGLPRYPARHDMMQDARSIQARSTRHEKELTKSH